MRALYQHLNQLTQYPLSGYEINELYEIPIVEVGGVSTIKPVPNGQWVVFLPNKAHNIGHWVLLSVIKPSTLEYFDSYGEPPPSQLIDRLPKHLKVIYSTYRYQREGNNVNTCGFHVLFRAFTQRYLHMDITAYYQFMKNPKDHDKAVVFYVTNFLGVNRPS